MFYFCLFILFYIYVYIYICFIFAYLFYFIYMYIYIYMKKVPLFTLLNSSTSWIIRNKSIVYLKFCLTCASSIFQSRYKSRLFDIHVFFAFFSMKIFDKFLRDLQSLYFVFKITLSKMRNLCVRMLSFSKNCSVTVC